MQIRVDKDNLRIIKLSQLESGEVDVTEVNFIFSPEYKDLIKTAVFTLGDKSYKVILQNDKCYIPLEVLVEGNKITIGVYAFKSEGEELILRYSPVPVTAEILKGSYVEEAENTSHPTPTEIEQLMELISKNTSDIESLDNRVTTLENKEGSCETQIENIKEDLNDIKSDIQNLEDDVTTINNSITDIEGDIDDIEGDIVDINGDISDINTSITNINQLDERQNRRLNSIDNFIRQWPKTEYKEGTSINLGKTIQATVQYEDDKVMYGDTEQDGTPTPESPIPISVVTGTQEVAVKGKNEISGIEYGDINAQSGAESTSTNAIISSNYIPYDTSKTYYLSINSEQAPNNKVLNLRFYNKDKEYIGYGSLYGSGSNFQITTGSQVTTTDLTPKYFKFRQTLSAGPITSLDDKIMITTINDMTYESYITPTTYTIHLGNLELAKIGNYQDYIYFDVDEGKWYKNSEIGKYVLTGNETFVTTSTTTTRTYYGIDYSESGIYQYSVATDLPNFLCEKFTIRAQLGSFLPEQVSLQTSNKNVIYIFNPNTTEAQARTILTGMKSYFALATPITTEITDTTLIQDLDNILAMMSVEGTTIIEVSGNLPATIKVRAFAQLQAAT